MRVKALEKIKATSSLTFVAGTLVMHMFVSGIWVSLPLQVVERLTGLFLSYLIIISFAKRWWHRRILAYERALAKSDDGAKSFELMPIELQKMLVDHLHFAVVTFDGQLKIRLETPAFPKSLSDIDDLDGRDLIEMLGLVTRLDTDDLQMLRFQLCHVFGMNKIQWLATSLSLPQEAQLQRSATAYVRLRYIPVYKMEKLARIHLILQDFTEVKEREVNAEMQRKNMEKLFALLQVSDSLFDLFMSETRKLFEDIKFDLKSLREKSSRDSQETANRMFRAVHTIKANAKLFKLNSIQDVAHTVENYLEELRQGKRHFTSAVLVELTQKIMTISEEVYSYASLRKEILNRSDRGASFNIKYRVQWIRSLMNQFASILRDPNFDRRHLKLIHKEFSRALSSFDKASLCEYIPGYNTMLQELAFSLGKELDEISVDLQCHHFDSTTLARINDILLHCLRNAVDHGIETPEQREAKGKSRKGQIRLKTMEKDGTVVIELSDNGRGIDLDRIKAKAIDMKLLTADQADQLTEQEAVSLLFHAGVSTSSAVTDVSGRGLGMDVVRDYVQGLSGQLTISFEKGQGTTISFWIPVATEELVAPLGIHDLREILGIVWRDHLSFARDRFELDYHNLEQLIVFTDKSSLIETLKIIFTELYNRCPNGSKIFIKLEEHLGRRRVDCLVFFRLSVVMQGETLPKKWAFQKEAKAFETAGSMLKKSGGSLFVRNPQFMEINIPSNIPVRFSEYEFNVLIFTERMDDLQSHIDNFFQKIMGGWKYRSYHYPFDGKLPADLQGVPCLVLLDSALVKVYVEMREENDRRKDGVVLFPEDEIDIDILDGSAILPENILFVPPASDEKHFHRCLAGVIFRRFLKEMVRDQANMGYRDIDILKRLAS